MEITPRQYGRLEMAAWALAKHSEHNEVCMVLSKGIMQVLDEIADRDDLDELHAGAGWDDEDTGREPDIPDWRDGAGRLAKEDLLTRIRLTVAIHQGENLSRIIEAVKKDTGISGNSLARLLGVNKARISEAIHGKPRKDFVARFAEVFGEGGAK